MDHIGIDVHKLKTTFRVGVKQEGRVIVEHPTWRYFDPD
jgi:hypothetical protein